MLCLLLGNFISELKSKHRTLWHFSASILYIAKKLIVFYFLKHIFALIKLSFASASEIRDFNRVFLIVFFLALLFWFFFSERVSVFS